VECDIAVPPGNHEVVVSCPGVKPYRFTVSRPVPSPSSEKLTRTHKYYQQALAKYRQQPTHDHAKSLASYSGDMGKQLYYHGREKEAHQYYLQSKELDPDPDIGWIFSKVCYHVGDRENLLWASIAEIEEDYCSSGKEARAAYQKFGRGHEEVKRHARDASRQYTELIRRWVALGGSAKVANQLHQRVLEFWSMAGFDPKDSRNFPYAIEGASFSFGPDEGGGEL